jgi:geranylgeranyl reductase family protein
MHGMIHSNVIIVGGGPAGSTCAWKLRQNGIPTIILDKETFPRPKTCAGWVTPGVWKNLQITVDEYPFQIISFRRLNFYFYGRKIPIKTRQYSIRRFEFDRWLVERAETAVIQHRVKQVRKEGPHYIVDDKFRCRYIVGAGGTHCPVYRSLFKNIQPRIKKDRIVALEEEFQADDHDSECHLWFFDHQLPGYAWYVPKGGGYLNVGIGGKYAVLQNRGETLFHHWEQLVQRLQDWNLVKGRAFKPKGCSYYIRGKIKQVQRDNAFLIGDAAGLATRDMGEGIGPAVASGIRAAEAIVSGKAYTIKSTGKYSAFGILFSR